MFRKFLVSFMLISLLLFSFGMVAQAGPKVLKLAHLNPEKPTEIATAAMAEVFKSMVESGTNGSVKVEIYPNGVLGNERETMEQVRDNITQSYIASGGGIAPFFPLFSIVNIPFSITDYSTAYKVYDGSFGKYLAGLMEKQTGYKVLAFGESGGFFQLTNSKRPIHSPKDMKGLKFRTMTIPIHMEFMRSLGASPTPIAWAEVYTALQTGVVDGQHNPIPIIYIGKLYEVQKYLTITNHMYTPYVWVMNKDFFNSLTDEEKRVVVEAARVANIAGRGINRVFEAGDKGLPFLAKKMQVYTPTTSELKEFRDITVPAAMKFIEKEYGKEGKELADAYLKAIEEAKNQ